MNDHTRFERDVAETFDRESRGRPVPDAIHDELLSYAGRTRQWPSWLASIKEPPMRLSNSLAVGSPTVRIAAVMAATLLLAVLLAGAGIAGQRLFAASADYVVDHDGDTGYTTIAEAVAVAQDGESVLIMNGTYDESVTISKDIELFGESRDGVILEFAAGCRLEGEGEFPWEKERICEPGVLELEGTADFWQPGPYALHLVESDATLSDLTFRHLSPGYGIYVSGGAPVIERVTYADNPLNDPKGGNSLMLRGGTSATVTDADLGWGAFAIEDLSPATVVDSYGGAVFSEAPRDEASGGPAVVRGNTLRVGGIWAEGLHVIEGNEIDMSADQFDFAGIFMGSGEGWIIKGNTIRNSTSPFAAIDVGDQAGPGEIVDNVLEGNITGIATTTPSLIQGNRIIEGGTGITLATGSQQVLDNVIEGMSDIGMRVGGNATVTGNTACGNGVDLVIGRLSQAEIDDSNEFCVIDDQRPE